MGDLRLRARRHHRPAGTQHLHHRANRLDREPCPARVRTAEGREAIAVISMRDAWGRGRYSPLMEAFKAKGISRRRRGDISRHQRCDAASAPAAGSQGRRRPDGALS